METAGINTVACSSAAAGPRGRRCLKNILVVRCQLCDELVILGYSLRSLAFNLEASAWDTLEWGVGGYVSAGCAADAVVVAFSSENVDDPSRLRSLRSGGAGGWVSIPDPPEDVCLISLLRSVASKAPSTSLAASTEVAT